ncbi:glycosyltransferase [Tepidibacillus sp. HK-1]|uniref:glycosyltransferase n=1 Tax=Tepidibacillus sp. HK-1 TaxID=1883407 RepID=UPI0008533AC8|nr:glycosyltransferase [Tepidibacillus sp. HK-1]GBF12468.1 processive diacylglycerol alpha-glucosyltransferase [Tepidibacillus sp. HK-1]
MKVLQINSVCGIGSTGRIVTDIHNILIEQGHESYIAYGRDLSKNCDTSIKIGSKIDNYSHVALTRIFDKHGFGSKKATQKFIEKVKELDPDIIHLHNIHGYYINIEVLFDYLKKADRPVVWTLHDCWSFTGHCAYFDYVGCDKWKTGCYDCPEKNSYPASVIIDNSKDNYIKKKELFTGIKNLTIVTPSKWLAGLVKQSYLREYPVEVINNGIDLDVFKPTQSDFRERFNLEDKFIILGVASTWDRRKGFGYFIELSKKIKNDEVIVLVGLSEKQRKYLPKNIIGITRTSNVKELAEIYTAADVFLNPTLEDNFPTTNLEALACGTPVITFDTGGSVECVDSKTGIVVKKDNLNMLRNEILNIKNGKKTFYNDVAINRAKSVYDKNKQYGEYLNLYKHSKDNKLRL